MAQAFLGGAEQAHIVHGKRVTSEHVLLQLSGADADLMLYDVMAVSGVHAKCTRIDLQVTIPLPHYYSPGMAIMSLKTGSWGRGRPPEVRLVEGGGGLDTVYIGSRSSNRLIRLYVKEVNGERYLRFEVEYRGDYASQIWSTLNKGGSKAQFINAELRRIPLWFTLSRDFERCVRNDDGHGVKTVTKQTDTVAWLGGLVSDVVKRMMADHDEGAQVRDLVRGWAELADRIDES